MSEAMRLHGACFAVRLCVLRARRSVYLTTVRTREAQHVAEVERGRDGVFLEVVYQRRDDLELEGALAAAVRARAEL